MKKRIQQLSVAIGCFVSLNVAGQVVDESLGEGYYSSIVPVGNIDKRLFDSLEVANSLHPTKFYEICGAFALDSMDSMMNEAAVAYFIGRNRYSFYNKTNVNYDASADGALAGSFAYGFGEFIDEYVNLNIANYSVLMQKAGEWYQNNRHYYFEHPENDSLYQAQIDEMFRFAEMLKNNPQEYIDELERQKLKREQEIEELINQLEGLFENLDFSEEESEEDE